MKRTVIRNTLFGGKYVNLVIEDGVIVSIDREKGLSGFDADGRSVIPGLIDTHAHGFVGKDTLDGDFEEICRFLALRGTTSWLPTAMCTDADTLEAVTGRKTDFPGTQILGFHLEGPYISEKFKGAQNEKYIKDPDYEEFCRFHKVKKITLAPERRGSAEFIRRISSEGVAVSIGHSDCDYDTALLAFDCGASCLTHTFNTMQPLHHRRPGPIGAAIQKGAYAEIIADGIHVHPASFFAALKLFGPEKLMLVSDAIRPAGLPEGTVSDSGGLSVTVGKGAVYLTGSDTLAGSSSTLWDCVRSASRMGAGFEEAIKMASTTPAEHLGLKKGRIAEGFDGDLILLDDKKEISEVFIKGERIEK
ncbi:MAG: N-acetylglucosamine-6-phosphate deacetylase [Clostridia bacterium]|nr:N-acetylglucosamine-6-phosphate deacetylase [Clostridia bacterium]